MERFRGNGLVPQLHELGWRLFKCLGCGSDQFTLAPVVSIKLRPGPGSFDMKSEPIGEQYSCAKCKKLVSAKEIAEGLRSEIEGQVGVEKKPEETKPPEAPPSGLIVQP
jgi:hypothetical protein